ncbi:MAG: phosphoenolpyruvate-protein phosphotransferase [Proteobacteria bacterium]|nr:phosphoenolpyruvate-protein phosphotransferase [Pseudomonadota bacterium]
MIKLTQANIRLNAQARDKTEAIRIAGSLLVDSGNMQSGYVDSMLLREKVANTYLGNGIAIPHGLPKDRELIIQTGISVTQFPAGVQWNQGETVYLVVAIAARSDEHIELLANLTDVLDDPTTVQRLARTSSPQDIIERLTQARDGAAASNAAPAAEDFEKGVDVALSGPAGLHARPATTFVEIAKQFESEIRVRHQTKVANGKSLVSLLKLGADKHASLRIMARGSDEDAALKALAAAVEHGLEDEAEATQASAAGPALLLEARSIPGIAASPGLAIGPLRRFRREKIVVAATASDAALEQTRLSQAIVTAKLQLRELHDELKARCGAARAAIFRAHEEFLDDPDLIDATLLLIRAGHSAGWSWRQSIEERAREVSALDDALLKERAVDLQDVGRRVLRLLADTLEDEPGSFDTPVILVAEDLSPSDTARLDPALIIGICTAGGGPTSHTAIIARSLDIPAIVGAGPALMHQADDTQCILDGDSGNLYLEPGEADLALARQAQQQWQARREAELLACYQPAITTDGQRIEVVANIGSAAEAEQAVTAGAEGVGLLRSEFLFLQRADPPSEDEQFAAYSAMTRALNGLPLIIRTLDIGGDKDAPYLCLPAEQNPFLGVRGIRLCLARPDLFKPQLRAIYRAAATGPVKIMFPMIATLEELLAARAIAEEVRRELNAPSVDIGIMVEVPSAVLMAPELAAHADFFSIGTNDLTQYVLAMDRLHPTLARQADALHPAVLRMIAMTVKAAKGAGKWVGVCGGMAGDPKGAAILAGLGVAELSMSIPSVAAIKARLRTQSLAQMQLLAQRALACTNAAQVRAL